MPEKPRSFFSRTELVTSALLFATIVVLGTIHATLRTWVIVSVLLVAGNFVIRRWLDGMPSGTRGR